jgi:Flp pilus assembly protein TadD
MTERESQSGKPVSDLPEDAAALRKMAELVGAERGRKQEAVGLWRRYLEVVGPAQSGEALLGLGRALVEAHREGEAVDVLRRCTDEMPASFGAYALLGEILRELGDLEAAADTLKRALALKPDDVQARVSLVICLDALGRRLESEAALSALRDTSAGDPAVLALVQELLQRRE